MAKSNEQYEEILDQLSEIKKDKASTSSQLATMSAKVDSLSKTLAEIQLALAQLKNAESGIDKDELKEAFDDDFDDYFKKHKFAVSFKDMTQDDRVALANILIESFNASTEQSRAKYAEKEKAEVEEYQKKRSIQGIGKPSEVAKWAPEYPVQIQRLVRWFGIHLFGEDEDPKNVHSILKVLGDVLMPAWNKQQEPSLKAWFKFKWNKLWKATDKWRFIRWYVIFLGALITIVAIGFYQQAVMDLDRTNRIFYKNVMKNEKRSKDYHELDSLIHSNSFFKTYRTLDRE